MAAFDPGKGTLMGAFNLGCDPEIFVSRRGVKKWHTMGSERLFGGKQKKGLVATDGVQIELHPMATHCRANLSNELQTAFRQLKAECEKFPEKLQVDFSQVVSVSKTELMRLSDESRRLGCLPSFNAYGRAGLKVGTAMPTTRSAAGHVHFNCDKLKDPDGFAKLLDVMVGIPCVMIDRDPAAARRRKKYGKAGEYRIPTHGFEYRTLSNFWLRSYQLMSLVFGMCKTTSAIEAMHIGKKFYEKDQYYGPQVKQSSELRGKIMDRVNLKKVETAINTNDFDLATEIFEDVVRPVYKNYNYDAGLTPEIVELWNDFVKQGIDAFFPADNDKILEHWCKKPEGHGTGWESWAPKHLKKGVKL